MQMGMEYCSGNGYFCSVCVYRWTKQFVSERPTGMDVLLVPQVQAMMGHQRASLRVAMLGTSSVVGNVRVSWRAHSGTFSYEISVGLPGIL